MPRKFNTSEPFLRLLVSPDFDHGVETPTAPEDFVRKHITLIQLFDEDDYLTIGELHYSVAHLEWAYCRGQRWAGIFENHSLEYQDIHQLLYTATEDVRRPISKAMGGLSYRGFDLLVVDLLKIDPEHRGEQLGLQALRLLMESSHCGLAVLHASPLLTSSTAPFPSLLEQRALRRYYGRLGFKRIPRTSHMVADLGKRLPEL